MPYKNHVLQHTFNHTLNQKKFNKVNKNVEKTSFYCYIHNTNIMLHKCHIMHNASKVYGV